MSYDEVARPKPGRGEYLIEVHFAGVNPVDTKIRKGAFALFRPRLPAIIGRDISGVVRAVGGKRNRGQKSRFKAGDQVFGMLDYDRGAYTEFTLASARELAALPKKVSEKEAGVIGVAALTAWQGLFDHGRLKKGQRVLIHGAAGGVGHFAVQFAKVRGATVIATASTRDLSWVMRLGADEVIDFKTQKFEEHTGEIDLVLDLVSGDTQARSWDVLKKSGGAIVSTLSEPSQAKAAKRSARGVRMVVKAKAGQLEQIAKLVAAGRVKVKIDKVFPLRKAAEAHRFLEKGPVRGKVALKVKPSWNDLGWFEDVDDPARRLALLANETLVGFPPAY